MSLVRKSTSAMFVLSFLQRHLVSIVCSTLLSQSLVSVPLHRLRSRQWMAHRLVDALASQTAAAASSDTVRPTKAISEITTQFFKRVLFFGPQAQPNDLEHLSAFYKVLAATYALLVFAIQHIVVDVPSCFAYSRHVQARQARSIATLHIAVDVHWRLATTKATQSL